jgi:hypothetical protein
LKDKKMNIFAKLKTQIMGGVNKAHHKAVELGLPLAEGERYAGTVHDKNGKPMHYLVLLPESIHELTWLGAARWTQSLGGKLPTTQELILIAKNLQSGLNTQWHWSSDLHNEKIAFIVHLGNGKQSCTYKIDEIAAIAVRRIPVSSNQTPAIIH